MPQPSKQSLTDASVLAWIMDNRFVTENRKPIEFIKHRCFIDYLADDHPDKASKKCAQVGATVLEAIDDFHLAGKRQMNVIHTLHTNDVIKGLVTPKINPLIEYNPAIKNMMRKVDSEGIKRLNDNYIYYRGANAESQAISISADVLKIDELDRSKAVVAEMFLSRLDASDYKWVRRFSNPSAVGFGVDALYQDSNQFHWFIMCSHCSHEWFIDYDKTDERNHYVDTQKAIFACGKCGKEIYDADKITGRWLARYPQRDYRHGYWFSQLMMPWFTAEEIIQKHDSTSTDYFYNFVLGKAFTPSDMVVNRDTILRACAPSHIPRLNVSLGVDQNVSEQIWVAMTPQGVFAHGKAKSWEEIEHLKYMWDATVVCDPNPYSTMPKQMAHKHARWYLCYFKQMVGMDIVQWKESVVYADRTRLLDLVAMEIAEAKMLFREAPSALEDYIKDWANIYRTTVEEEDGRVKSEWLKKEGKLSDFSFATAYARIGLGRVMGGSAQIIEPMRDVMDAPVTDTLREDGKFETTLGKSISDTLEEMGI